MSGIPPTERVRTSKPISTPVSRGSPGRRYSGHALLDAVTRVDSAAENNGLPTDHKLESVAWRPSVRIQQRSTRFTGRRGSKVKGYLDRRYGGNSGEDKGSNGESEEVVQGDISITRIFKKRSSGLV